MYWCLVVMEVTQSLRNIKQSYHFSKKNAEGKKVLY